MPSAPRAATAEFGIFLPVGNGGWIMSETTPVLDGSYSLNRSAAVLAEELGLDFIMSMAKWRGYGGKTNHWGRTLESVTTMAALAEATSRVKIYATAHTLVFPPAAIAKMMTTLDHISGGRAGLNIVAGAYKSEFAQMGLWRDEMDHSARYDLAREWIQIIKRLWTEPSVTFHGQYFQVEDCVSDPKPVQQPRPYLICAGMSETGLRFTVEEADACFTAGKDMPELAKVTRRTREIAEELETTIETFAMFTLVPGDTDAEAERRVQLYKQGADIGAIQGLESSYPPRGDGSEQSNVIRARERRVFQTEYLAGSAQTLAERINDALETADLDGMMLIFPDYIGDLQFFGQEVLPLLRQRTGPAVDAGKSQPTLRGKVA